MDEANILDAREWLAYAQSDLGVAKYLYDKYYPKPLEPYSVSMRYPNELFLEDRHAKNAIDMAQEFFDWAKDAIDSAEKA